MKTTTRRTWQIVIGGAALALIGMSSLAGAQTILGCVDNQAGSVRIIDPPATCKKNETSRQWSVTGPQGPAGPKGPAGAQGPPGTLATFDDTNGLACTAPGGLPGTITLSYSPTGVPRLWCRTGTGRFIDHGTTVTDTQTGLMWEKKVVGGTGQSCLASLHGVDAVCTWDEAIGDWLDWLNGRLNMSGTQTGFAGYTDWRLPTSAELISIQACGNSGCTIVDPVFGPTSIWPAGEYWSSTSRAGMPEQAFIVWIGGPVAYGVSFPKTDSLSVRAVRGGS